MKEIDWESDVTITEKDIRRLKKVKINLMRNPKFALWSGILMLGKTSISESVPTAYTNGRDDTYGIRFVRALSDKELGFVILHEALHKAFRHLSLWRTLFIQNPQLANMACDYVINPIAIECDPDEQVIAMPKAPDGSVFGLYDEKYKGMNSGQVFKLLQQENKQNQGQCSTCGGSGKVGDNQGGSGQDKSDKGEEKDNKGQGSGGGKPCPDCHGNGHGGFDEHDWGAADDLTEQEKRQLEAEVDRAIRQGQIASSRQKGEGSALGDRALEELLAPQFDWRELLREFMVNTCRTPDSSSWRRPNRRFLHQDILMPTLIGENMGEIVIGVDTSGSVSDREIAIFLSEIKGICELVKPQKLHLLYWDGEVATPHEVYELGNLDSLTESTRVVGGGGTSPTCVSRYLEKHKEIDPECIVMLTDGYLGGDWGENWGAQLLWVISGDKDAVSPYGKTVYVEDWE